MHKRITGKVRESLWTKLTIGAARDGLKGEETLSEGPEWKCSKCGSGDFRKRHMNLRGSMGTTGLLDCEEVTAYFCNRCGYVEFYSGKR